MPKQYKAGRYFITFMAINYGFSLVLKLGLRKNGACSLLGQFVSKERTVAMLNAEYFIAERHENAFVILTLLYFVSVAWGNL